jgi:hypothetical protein
VPSQDEAGCARFLNCAQPFRLACARAAARGVAKRGAKPWLQAQIVAHGRVAGGGRLTTIRFEPAPQLVSGAIAFSAFLQVYSPCLRHAAASALKSKVMRVILCSVVTKAGLPRLDQRGLRENGGKDERGLALQCNESSS